MSDAITTERCGELLDFYFGPASRPDCDLETFRTKTKSWFMRSDAFDAQIRERFEADMHAAARGELDAWKATPHGRLGLVVLLDQFPRNLNRGSAKAFANDPKALALTLEGVERGDDAAFTQGERMVFYLPAMHSEELAIQDKALALYTKLASEPTPLQPELQMALKFADRHRYIVERFGRFPHRNAALGRDSTPEEVAFLKEPNSSF